MPAIVLCQGLSGDKNKVLPNIAKKFSDQGYITLASDYRGCGDSEGDRQSIKPVDRIEDTRYAIAWLSNQPDVNSSNMFLYGLSYGAATCIAAAANNHNIKAIAAVSGAVDGIDFMRGIRDPHQWINFKEKIKSSITKRSISGEDTLFKLKELVPFPESFWNKYSKLKSSNDSESIPDKNNTSQETSKFTLSSAIAMTEFKLSTYLEALSAPTCVIHGEKDDIILLEDVNKALLKINAEKEIHIIPGSDHIDLDHGPGLDKQMEIALKWFEKYKQLIYPSPLTI